MHLCGAMRILSLWTVYEISYGARITFGTDLYLFLLVFLTLVALVMIIISVFVAVVNYRPFRRHVTSLVKRFPLVKRTPSYYALH